MKQLISIVISVYNEEDSIEELFKQLCEDLALITEKFEIEVIFVNDGSSDNSKAKLELLKSEQLHLKVVNFSRNFGHEAAMLAGIDNAKGEAVICMDADLQHPPSEISNMLEKFQEGNEVIMMYRKSRKDVGFMRRILNSIFYSFINKISDTKIEQNVSDFFLISKRIAEILKTKYRNKTRFLRWIIQNLGFNQTKIEYVAPERFAGKSKYSFIKLIKLAFNAITNSTISPLKLGLFVGIIFSLFSFIVGIYSLVMWFFDKPMGGYTTLIVFLSFAFGILFLIIGIIGEYLGKIFIETKDLPIYIIESIKD